MPKEKPQEQITAEVILAPQIGTDTTLLVKGKYDIRRLSKLNPLEKAWLSFFLLEDGPDGKDKDLTGGGGYYAEFCDGYMNLSVSEEGWRVNKLIQMVAASKGAPGVGELQRKPNILQRNITDRKWKQNADEQGRTVVE